MKRIGSFLILKSVDLILSTCQVRIYGLDLFIGVLDSKSTLLVLWHNRLLLAPFALEKYIRHANKVVAVISKSQDGNWIQAVIDKYPHTSSIRIAHDKKIIGLQKIVQSVKERSLVIITPDGPKGPLYEVKAGVLLAAKETGSPIIPFTWKGPHWKIDSWDKFRIPKPFSRIEIHFKKPLYLSSRTPIEEDKKALATLLNS